MLGKLLKYDIRATSRMILPVYLVYIALSILCGVGVSVLLSIIRSSWGLNEESRALGNIYLTGTVSLSVFAYLGMIVCALLVTIFCLSYYYKKFFTSQGYLTHTLPASAMSQIWSKILTSFIWYICSGVVFIIGCAAIFAVIGIAVSPYGNFSLFSALKETFRKIPEFMGDMWSTPEFHCIVILALIYVIVLFFAWITIGYACVTLGCQIAKKHKVFASIGIYVGANYLIRFIQYTMLSVGSLVLETGTANSGVVTFGSVVSFLVLGILLNLAFSVGALVLMHHSVTKKLNLT